MMDINGFEALGFVESEMTFPAAERDGCPFCAFLHTLAFRPSE